MPFMKPSTTRERMIHVETTEGTCIIPGHLVIPDAWVNPTWSVAELKDYVTGDILTDEDGNADAEEQTGWYVRLSAPGYLDCTDWMGPYPSESDALDALAETHDVCRTCWEQYYAGETPCPDPNDGSDDVS